jgi:hypothetical protein
LNNITIPKSVMYIGKDAFKGINSLSYIYMYCNTVKCYSYGYSYSYKCWEPPTKVVCIV